MSPESFWALKTVYALDTVELKDCSMTLLGMIHVLWLGEAVDSSVGS